MVIGVFRIPQYASRSSTRISDTEISEDTVILSQLLHSSWSIKDSQVRRLDYQILNHPQPTQRHNVFIMPFSIRKLLRSGKSKSHMTQSASQLSQDGLGLPAVCTCTLWYDPQSNMLSSDSPSRAVAPLACAAGVSDHCLLLKPRSRPPRAALATHPQT